MGRVSAEAVLVFIDGTICDRGAVLHLAGTTEFYEREAILQGRPVPGSVPCLCELARRYQVVYIGARPAASLRHTEEWLRLMGFPEGPVYLGATQEERLTIAKELGHTLHIVAGIGDRWDDNELELGCLSVILKEHEGNWDTVRKHLLGMT
jgi:hypothetical protein